MEKFTFITGNFAESKKYLSNQTMKELGVEKFTTVNYKDWNSLKAILDFTVKKDFEGIVIEDFFVADADDLRILKLEKLVVRKSFANIPSLWDLPYLIICTPVKAEVMNDVLLLVGVKKFQIINSDKPDFIS